ncbi:MAG TPA: MaoC family dehydratase N-terminal domain-containing protein [Roseomonas sp.]
MPGDATVVEAMLPEWIGRWRESEDELTRPAMRRLAAMLDRDGDVFAPGDPVPPHWAVLLFDDAAPQGRLGPDGHPVKGDFLPLVPLPRRMLGGRRMTYHAPPRIGDLLRRRSEITAITPKTGKSGRLVFVAVRHSVTGPQGLVSVEEQDIAYREAAAPGQAPAAPAASAPMPAAHWTEAFLPDPVLLFRYSALTFNTHRIHYDADYARGAEGYPALVVNGGLSTMMLLEAACRHAGGRPLTRYAARTIRPLFSGRAAALHGAGGRLWVTDAEGALALSIEAEFAA